MNRTCLNCGHEVIEKYCPECSQATNVGRITWQSFGNEFIHTLAHADRSIVGTTWCLLKNPGKALHEYIIGKRKKYHSPVGFFLVWVTLAIIIHRTIISIAGFHPVLKEGITFKDTETVKAFIVHGELFYILIFPLSAAIFYFLLAKPLYSYIESIVITMYGFAITNMFFVMCYLLGGVMLRLNVLHWKFYLFQIVLTLTYTIWVCIDLFRKKSMSFFWVRLIFYLIINSIVVLKCLELLASMYLRVEKLF